MDGITNEVVYFSATQKETAFFFFNRLCNHRIETCGSKLFLIPRSLSNESQSRFVWNWTQDINESSLEYLFCLPWAFHLNFLPGYIWALRAAAAPQLWFKASRQKVLLHCLLQAILQRTESYGQVSLEWFASENLCHRKIVAVPLQYKTCHSSVPGTWMPLKLYMFT